MRPRYETPEDEARERAIAEELARIWRVRLIKLRDLYPCDWAILAKDAETILAYVEIKDRNGHSMEQLDRWGGVFFSALKWGLCSHLCRVSDRPFIFVPKAASVLYAYKTWAQHMHLHDGVNLGGRRDRGDPDDIEPVIMLRAHRFRIVNEPYLGG
jgi:hypothetical protein